MLDIEAALFCRIAAAKRRLQLLEQQTKAAEKTLEQRLVVAVRPKHDAAEETPKNRRSPRSELEN